MEITFYGAVRTVTGSQHMLSINGHRLLLDCGLYQGKRKETFHLNRELLYDASAVDALVLSHAHIDHSGNIPSLVKRGFRGEIVSTFATRDLCAAMLRDSGYIQEKDVEYVNKKRARQGKALFEPLYTQEDAVESLQYFTAINYGRPYNVLPGVTVTFYDAGHMLGSAIVAIDAEDASTGATKRIVFSGDLGRPGTPIIRDPTLIDGADVLLIESTYGSRTHESFPDAKDKLRRVVRETAERHGVVVIPSFAVGRTQTLVYMLHQLIAEGALPPIPVFVDSPLAINATNIFQLHPEAYDQETRAFMREDTEHDPFGFDSLRYTRTVAQSKELNEMDGPAVIISASGMAEAGRIQHHLRNRVTDARNTVLIVGWQAPDTLGRRLVERAPEVKIFGEMFELRARVEKINGFSAHADRDELLEWAAHMTKKPAQTFVVHGEEAASLAFKAALEQELGFQNVVVPALKESFKI
ncbi:MAG: MBL fold metallo-hydrolase [Anaerolineae bacterium]|nr:MBL fold metallo-hydrolase [Anaerolineae bacterium]